MPCASISRRSGKQAAAVTKVRLSALRLPSKRGEKDKSSTRGGARTRTLGCLIRESENSDDTPDRAAIIAEVVRSFIGEVGYGDPDSQKRVLIAQRRHHDLMVPQGGR